MDWNWNWLLDVFIEYILPSLGAVAAFAFAWIRSKAKKAIDALQVEVDERIKNERLSNALVDTIEGLEDWILEEIEDQGSDVEQLLKDPKRFKKVIGAGAKRKAAREARKQNAANALAEKVKDRT